MGKKGKRRKRKVLTSPVGRTGYYNVLSSLLVLCKNVPLKVLSMRGKSNIFSSLKNQFSPSFQKEEKKVFLFVSVVNSRRNLESLCQLHFWHALLFLHEHFSGLLDLRLLPSGEVEHAIKSLNFRK